MSRFLIVTADDFGIRPEVNEAIEEAHRHGILTAASLMMGERATEDAVRRAHRLPALRVGLHLVLADGHPLCAPHLIPDLLEPDGRFGTRMLVDGVRYFFLPRVRRQLEIEIRAQFMAFRRTGLKLDHVNAHKHFHLHPTLLSMILAIGREFGLDAMRIPHEPLAVAIRLGGLRAAALGCLLLPWIGLMKSRLRRAGVTCNDCLCGVARSGSMNTRTLLDLLQHLPPGVTEVYGHPAATHGVDPAGTPGYQHAAELEALVDPAVVRAVEALGASRGGYQDAIRLCSSRR